MRPFTFAPTQVLPDLGVYGVGEVHRRGIARQNHDPALRGEGVDLFRIEIDLQRRQKLVGVLDVALPLDHLPQPRQPLLIARRDRTVFVFPVRGNAFLGHLVHLFGADLHFEGVPFFGDDGGVQRLVEVVARNGDEILDASRHRPPLVVNDAQHRVAIGLRLRDDAQRQHVVDLIDRDALPLQLLPDAVKALDARFDPRLNLVLLQLLFDDALHFGQKRLAFLAARLDGVLDLVVGDGIDVLEGQVFEFAADFAHAQAVRDGRVDVQRLARDLLLPLRREKLQGAHVVQAVGQLDQDDADVVHHGQHHLAHVFGLRFFGRGEIDLADLGDAFDDVGDLLAEFGLDLVDGDGGVFDRVVQQAGGDGRGVEPHLGQHA